MPSRVRQNVVANYLSQVAVTVMALALLPVYLRTVGEEGYGLIGFFALLQVWFGLLDLGLSATMGREAARFNGNAVDARQFRELFRAMELFFVAMGCVGALTIALIANLIASDWLQNESIQDAEVSEAIRVMGLIIGIRWIGGLFRGVVNGFERQVWLGVYSVGFNFLRYVGVLPVMAFYGPTVSTFFYYQLAVASVELIFIVAKAYSLVPRIQPSLGYTVQLGRIVPKLRFALSVSFVGVVWVLVTQSDKLVLSRLLTLSEYGLFAMAASAASGIMLFASPISAAVQPRLARLHAEGHELELLRLYRKATLLIGVMVFPAATMLAMFAESALWIWTGDQQVASSLALVFSLYVLGNAVLAVAAFPYYLQFAKGDMRLHLYGNVVLLILLVPSIVYAAAHYGMNGAGWAWLVVVLSYLLLWVPLVHRRFAPGIHVAWLLRDIGLPLAVSSIGSAVAWALLPEDNDRLTQAVLLMLTGILVLFFTAVSVPDSRSLIWSGSKAVASRISSAVLG